MSVRGGALEAGASRRDLRLAVRAGLPGGRLRGLALGAPGAAVPTLGPI